jgi:hypothetical protein
MARNQKNSWTPEADEQLRALVLAGASVHAISAQLKRTMRAVRVRAHLLGLSIAIDEALRNQRNTAKRRHTSST